MTSPTPKKLTRRQFIGTGTAVGGALVLGGAEGCSAPDAGRNTAQGGAGGAVRADVPYPVSDFELEEISITELHSGMVSGRWTSREITELYLKSKPQSLMAPSRILRRLSKKVLTMIR